MANIRETYAAIDLRASAGDVWPTTVPTMTADEAERAARRLWRFAMGGKCPFQIVVASGNRRSYVRATRRASTGEGSLQWQTTFVVNPDQGWRRFVHDLSHTFVRRCNPGERPHSKFHARFEAKLVREVIKRGWLDGRLRNDAREDEPKAEPVDRDAARDSKRREELKRIEARILNWERKELRAQRALTKLRRRQKYYASKVQA